MSEAAEKMVADAFAAVEETPKKTVKRVVKKRVATDEPATEVVDKAPEATDAE